MPTQMSEISDNPDLTYWLVIIQKTHHGPYTQSQITTLLDQKIISINDLICQVGKDMKAVSDWKFIWQFSVWKDYSKKTIDKVENPEEKKTYDELTTKDLNKTLGLLSAKDLIFELEKIKKHTPPTDSSSQPKTLSNNPTPSPMANSLLEIEPEIKPHQIRNSLIVLILILFVYFFFGLIWDHIPLEALIHRLPLRKIISLSQVPDTQSIETKTVTRKNQSQTKASHPQQAQKVTRTITSEKDNRETEANMTNNTDPSPNNQSDEMQNEDRMGREGAELNEAPPLPSSNEENNETNPNDYRPSTPDTTTPTEEK